jgi:hypothetical protein
MLTLNPTTRRWYHIPALAVILGLAVFLWGLHYKLSLYGSVASQHATPAVKLLSPKEHTVPSGQIERRLGSGQRTFDASFNGFRSAAPIVSYRAHLALSNGYVEDVEPRPIPIPERCHTFAPCSPRGPPIAI